MPVRKSVTIPVNSELLAVAEGLIATGRCETIGKVMRSALRDLEELKSGLQARRDSKTLRRRLPVFNTTKA